MRELNPLFRSRTARRILMRIVPASLAVLLVVGYLMTSFTRTELEREALQRLSLLSLQFELSLDREIDFIVNATHAIASNEIMIDSLIDDQSRTTYLPIFFGSLRMPVTGSSRLAFADYRGRIITQKGDFDGDFQGAPWLKKIMTGQQVVQFSADGMRVVVPVLYNGLAEGVLVVDLPPETMTELMVQRTGATINAATFDGVVIASSHPNIMAPGQADRMAEARDWLSFRKDIVNYPGLRLTVAQNKKDAFAAVDSMVNALFIVGAILALSLIASILITLNSLTGPLSRLTDAVRRMENAEDMSRKVRVRGPEEFQVLAAAFNDMTARLLRSIRKQEYAEAASEAKSEFLSSMSHELRTPMNAILGFGQILELDEEERLSEEQKEAVRHIMAGGEHLLNLINEVLDLAKIESNKLSLSIEPVYPGELVEDCMSIIRPLAQKFDVHVSVDPSVKASPPVMADRTRLKQALLNLLSNAVKYNRPGGTAALSVEDGSDGMLLLSVRDTGIGIPESAHADVFNAFSRFSPDQEEVEGTGVGLTITKRLIEIMGGRIGFFSAENEGSTFWIEIPLSAEKASILEPAPSGPDEGRNGFMSDDTPNRTVLYVEDNPANLKLIEMLVKRVPGVSLISAHNAEIGVVMVEEHKPDLILMDINLPGMSGIEAIKKIRENPELADIPAVAISANAMPRDVEKGMDAGFMDYLVKPIQLDQVRKLFDQVFQTGNNAGSATN